MRTQWGSAFATVVSADKNLTVLNLLRIKKLKQDKLKQNQLSWRINSA